MARINENQQTQQTQQLPSCRAFARGKRVAPRQLPRPWVGAMLWPHIVFSKSGELGWTPVNMHNGRILSEMGTRFQQGWLRASESCRCVGKHRNMMTHCHIQKHRVVICLFICLFLLPGMVSDGVGKIYPTLLCFSSLHQGSSYNQRLYCMMKNHVMVQTHSSIIIYTDLLDRSIKNEPKRPAIVP